MTEWIVDILAGIGALAIVWMAYKAVTPEPVEQLPHSLSDPEIPTDSRDFAVALAVNLNAPLVTGNRLVLLRNGVEIFPPMLEAIERARESVNFLTFIYWTGDIAERFADALADAARRGVDVRVLLDYVGSRPMPDSLVDQMVDAGCLVARFHSVRWYALRRLNNRTHRKILVVDGKLGFTGGVGIAEEWSGDAEDSAHWRDDHFRVEGPVVHELQGAFAENWRQATGEVLSGPEMLPPLEREGPVTVVPLLGTPRGSISRISFAYWLSLHAARTTVNITTPYFVPDRPLKKVMMATARRGVDVTLLVPNENNDRRIVRWAAQSFYPELIECGVRIFEYQPTMVHVKRVTVDGTWAVIGSANFDNRSFNLNYEIALAISDAEFVGALDRCLERDLERAREITLDEAKRRFVLARARDHAVLALREQL
jgi:cardiolipin synthase